MSYELVEVKGGTFSGIKVKTTNENMLCIKDMGELWNRFMTENLPGKICSVEAGSLYGLYLNYEGDFTKPYEYMACMKVIEADSSYTCINVPDGKYARFTAIGDMVSVVGELWAEIWETDLNRSYKFDFEKYYDCDDRGSQKVEIYIGVQ